MAGNIFSRALMSIFMDRKARAKYEAIQSAKRDLAAGRPVSPPPPEPDDDTFDELPETLIQRAIDSASAELERKKNLPPGRQALIEQALSIHDSKSELLKDLPQEQREKLIVMAMHAFGAEIEPKKGKAGPTGRKRKKT